MTNRVLAARWFPLLRTFHLRRNWLYDVCRFAGTRDLQVVFDVGANVGDVTAEMARFFPAAEVHAFELIIPTFNQLTRATGQLRNVKPHALALGKATEEVVISLQECSLFNSLQFACRSPAPTGDFRSQQISVITADEFCQRQGLPFVDVLKTDAQGFDVEVLAGAEQLIAANGVAFVYSEVGFQKDDSINTPFSRLHGHLSDRGFELSGFYEQWGRDASLGFCNALYAHPRAMRKRFSTHGSP